MIWRDWGVTARVFKVDSYANDCYIVTVSTKINEITKPKNRLS